MKITIVDIKSKGDVSDKKLTKHLDTVIFKKTVHMHTPNTIWWIEPLTQDCNASVSAYFGSEAAQQQIMTSEGKKDLYQMRNYTDVIRYAKSAFSCNFFKQEGSGAEIKPWVPPTFMKRKTPYMTKSPT